MFEILFIGLQLNRIDTVYGNKSHRGQWKQNPYGINIEYIKS